MRWGDSRALYTLFVLLVAGARLGELRIARRHQEQLLARGAVEIGAGHYPWMVLLHGAWLAGCLLEVWLLGRPFLPVLGCIALAVFLGAMALRYWVIRTLGERWTTRILVLPGAPPVEAGPYRFTRHPNYLAVILEIAALPLVHTAWLTAFVMSFANAVVLRERIRTEERALAERSTYGEVFADRPRFLPQPGRPARRPEMNPGPRAGD
ncbi:MAG TPA: isoprenylcysteine carboxyl methyltransferase family protein [Thermoanaerobaculia bacterium]|nr:isoprenylcysteine carboxyl methyltransferase family protein [Thermoanaerobaculia bacterium]